MAAERPHDAKAGDGPAGSGEQSPGFRAQMSAMSYDKRRLPGGKSIIALVAVAALTITTIGVLLFTRHAMAPLRSGSTPVSVASAAILPCRLPIVQQVTAVSIEKGTGAFATLPATSTPGVVTAVEVTDDPTSDVKLPNGEARVGLSYNWSLKRWLPVPYKWIAPDGARYAYTDSQSRVHLVGIKDGSDRVIAFWGALGRVRVWLGRNLCRAARQDEAAFPDGFVADSYGRRVSAEADCAGNLARIRF